ncbi:MAG: hypothetical protein EBY65_08460, partial [Acidimicrobiia bacterium]|nr:hypothetical protein [Acidimicrobiia bacterium]
MGDVESLETLEEDADFLEYCYRSVLSELGFSAEHAAIVAACVSDGDRNGKLTQGMGVFEIPVLLARTGTMDVNAEPVVAAEGPSWLVVDAQRSSGQWAVTMAMRAAIAKAREHAIAIGFVRDFNDAGAFGTYVRMAAREGMMAIATNNSLPLVSPWGGMENVLSGAPFAAATPGGEHPPIVSDIQAVEVHDGDLSEAYFQGRRLKGEFLVDPHTGELTDDPAPYFERMEDYGRISDCRAPTVFGTPRMYAFNLFTEMLAGVINPGARMSPEIAGPPSYWLEPRDEALTGGACVIVIDPSHWMPAGEAGARSDRLVDAVKGAKRRPGVEEIHLPGERGWRTMATGAPVRILPAHWESFVQIVESDEDAEAEAEQEAEVAEMQVDEGKKDAKKPTAAAAAKKTTTGDRTDDPVRMYLREMGSVELLSREGEIAIAKGCPHLSADFNCTVTEPGYVNDVLDR